MCSPGLDASMNFYVSVITDIVEYIEASIASRLTLAELSARAGISDFHFNRMFSTIAGVTLKQYVLGRKLAYAAQMLKATTRSVIDISLEMGFEYPEVFSRSFKNHLGISPAEYRRQDAAITPTPKASIVERDIINYRGTLALKGEVRHMPPLKLYGVCSDINKNSAQHEQTLRKTNETFIMESAALDAFDPGRFYTAVTCSGREDGEYHVFCGRQASPGADVSRYGALPVPEGWYVDFLYAGDMFDISEVFIDDLYKWIMVKEARIAPNGIGMLNIYESSYAVSHEVHILVPVQQPV